MYTNQTAEELELERCAPIGIYHALTSSIMKFNVFYTLIIGFSTLFLSYPAIVQLTYHNIFPTSTRIHLYFALINSIINQIFLIQSRIRQFYRSIVFANEQCLIEYHQPECFPEFHFYYFTNLCSTSIVVMLTIDRLIVLFFPVVYKKNMIFFGVALIIFAILLTSYAHFVMFYNVPLAGFVPMCHYPPQLSLNTLDLLNQIITILMLVCFISICLSLLHFLREEKRIRNHIYDTNLRYNARENLMTAKSVFYIILIQLIIIFITTVGIIFMTTYEAEMGEDVFQTFAHFLTGVLYVNFSLPIIIWAQTKRTINRRRLAVEVLTKFETKNVDFHMNSLRESWR